MNRRHYLSSLAGLGALSTLPGADAATQSLSAQQTGDESYHPGPPRVMHAGETIADPPAADYKGDTSPDDRDLLAPRIPDPQRDPDNYPSDAVTWRVVETPADSEIDGFAPSPDEYDYGTDNVRQFDPDVPGTYRLELDAPDGTHQLAVRVVPEPSEDAPGKPRVRPTATYDTAAEAFVVDANQAVAPDSETAPEDLTVEFLTDDRDGLSETDVMVDGASARVPASAIDGSAKLHVLALDERPSVIETIELDADAQTATPQNAPPEWLKDATMYEIFTRSFGSEAGEVDFQYLQDRVDYLDELGVDVVWLTPIVAAGSHRRDEPGGPHGYDTINYFQTAEGLGSIEEYEAFVDSCHERGIKVCFDLVINHTEDNHPFFQDALDRGPDSKYYEWYERMTDGTPANYFSWTTLMNVNYQWLAMREHILSVVDFWAEKVDGFRCDVAYGVPHGFWKEVRQRVKAHDTEFFLLDETIPYMPRFSEQEFDQHFDDVLYETLVDIGQGLDASHLFDALAERNRRGIPDRTLFLQYLENHDLPRYLDSVDKPAERAAAAATFTLPGTPMLYHGQERALPEYSDSRVTDQGHTRAFMNWEEYDEDHLAFYKSLIAARDEIPALTHDADLVGAFYQSDSKHVVAYGRDAGEQQVVVVLNFGEDSTAVDLRGPVSTTDLRTGSDLGVDSDGETTRVQVDSVAILETPSLSGLGTHVAGIEDESGDDAGPGNYTYPTSDAYADGAFDLTGLDLYESETAYQLRFTVDGPVENPFEYDGGFSVQHLQVYVRDPTSPDGANAARDGVDATLRERYQYRIVADGQHGARVETPAGDVVAEGSVFTSPSTHSIRIDLPKYAIPGGLAEKQLAPLLLGYDPDTPGEVVPVGETAGEHQFGGAAEATTTPVIDLFVPDDSSQHDVLTGDEVRLPYVLLTDPLDGELIAEWDDETGDDSGPGGYTYPTGEDFTEGALDIDAFDVYDEGDRYRFVYEMTDLTNPRDGGLGFSLQQFQLYVRNSAASDVSTATAGREGTNVAFADPYHYRIVVSGFDGESVVENGAGETVTDDVAVGAYPSLDAVAFSVPKNAVGGDLDQAALAPLVFGYDSEAPGNVRRIAAEASETTFGGGSSDADPAVVDMIVPPETNQADVLETGDALPLRSLSTFSGTLLKEWDDETGDDHGPGSYTYPSAEILSPGTFDMRRVELYRAGSRYRFVYYLDTEIGNPWSGSQGFSLFFPQVYIRNPTAGSDIPTSAEGRKGTNTRFQQPYHYRIAVTGYSMQAVEAADGSIISEDVGTAVYPDLQALAFDFPVEAIDGALERMQFAPLIFGYDGFATGKIRAVNASPTEWKLGGGRDDEQNSNAIDMITPDGVSQSDAMAFAADSAAKLPFVPQQASAGTPFPVASDRTVFATDEATLDATGSSDPDGQSLSFAWDQTGGPAVDLSDPSVAQPTFTAPAVDEQTELTFEVTVTDTDGNSATATATVTVRPQSENPAPVVDASMSPGLSEPVNPGTTVPINAHGSTDPNDGSLGFAWDQTGGPAVDLDGADAAAAFFTAPRVDDETTLTFEVTVSDGQGKTSTDTVSVTIVPDQGATTAGETTADGDGPGFGTLTGVLGTAGGAAYAARRLLDGDVTDTDEE